LQRLVDAPYLLNPAAPGWYTLKRPPLVHFARPVTAIEVDSSIGGERVVRVLDQLAGTRGLPRQIVVDNGPEFRGRALDAWAHARGVELQFIRPGKPVDNAYIEAFNGRLRDECLNQHWFLTLPDARVQMERWRVSYNTARPHRALKRLTPQQHREQLEQQNKLNRLSA
jgi:putative transposase